MLNVKLYLIHILYRLFLSLQKIQNLNLKLEKVKNITETENKLIEIFCLSIEPPIIKLFHSILTKNNTNEIKTYMSIQKWLKLTESSESLIEQPKLQLKSSIGSANNNNNPSSIGLIEQPKPSVGSNNNPSSIGLIEHSCFLVECIDNITKDAIKLQFEIDSYIYKFIYSKSLVPNLIILMEKICCLLDGYDSCSKYTDIIHDELLPLLQYWFKNWF